MSPTGFYLLRARRWSCHKFEIGRHFYLSREDSIRGHGSFVCVLVLLIVTGIVAAPTAASSPPGQGPAFVFHQPISIVTDANFTPANGVVGGSGAPDDPYVISGWEITASIGAAISIVDTRAPFVIRDVFAAARGSNEAAVVLTNVSDGGLEASIFANSQYGFRIDRSRNVSVADSEVGASAIPGWVGRSQDVRIEGNDLAMTSCVCSFEGEEVRDLLFRGNDIRGIVVRGGYNLTFESNRVAQGSPGNDGMRFIASPSSVRILNNSLRDGGGIDGSLRNATIVGNRVRSQAQAVHLIDSQNVSVEGNEILEVQNAISIERSSAITVSGNTVTSPDLGTGTGIRVIESTLVTVRANVVAHTGTAIVVASPMGVSSYQNRFVAYARPGQDDGANAWDGGYPTPGNYWSTYSGQDRCYGPGQDVCGLGDGIGDTPFSLDDDSVDRYPWLPPNVPPVAALELPDYPVAAGGLIEFDGSLSYDSDGIVLSYAWDFGDGWNGTSRLTSHHYSSGGEYIVRLTVTDDRGATSTDLRTLQVLPLSPEVRMVAHPAGFRLGVPVDWDVRMDQTLAGTSYELIVTATHFLSVVILVNWERDPSVREDAGYVGAQVNEAIEAVLSDQPMWSLVHGPRFRQIAGHAGSTFVIRNNSGGQFLKFAIVFSDIHDSFWLFALASASNSPFHYPIGDAVLEVMLDSLEITMAPASSPPAPTGFTWLVAGITAAVGIALVAIFLLILRSRRPLASIPGEIRPGGWIPPPCPSCGARTEPGAKFCGSCGRPLLAGPERLEPSDESKPP